jgi:hypothetical protein
VTSLAIPYRVYRQRWPMVPAIFLGMLQILVGIDTIFTHFILPPSSSILTTIAAVMFVVLGIILTLFVVISISRPVPLIEANEDGLALTITSPGEPPVLIPWDALKSIEIGRAGRQQGRRDDPVCLILRFAGARVHRPSQLVGVFHSTRGSFYFRGSQLGALNPIVERLAGLMKEQQKGDRREFSAEED